jgi:hypothetical protein
VPNHVALGGLALDIAGAVLLARSLFFVSPTRYAAEATGRTFAHIAGHEPDKDADHAREWAETRVGASLLIAGFLGQALGVLKSDWGVVSAVIVYALTGGVFVAALFGVRRLTKQRELAVFAAQLEAGKDARWRYNHWASYARTYRSRPGRAVTDLDSTIQTTARRMGEHPWQGYEPGETDLRPPAHS